MPLDFACRPFVSKNDAYIDIRYKFLCQSFFDGIDELGRLCHSACMISPSQCRAARGLLDWSQQELADKAKVGVVTVRQLEAGAHQPRRATLEVIRRCLEEAGVEFIEENGGGVGVRMRDPEPKQQGRS
jgi:DNA-binding transcriptional regulator YiaG